MAKLLSQVRETTGLISDSAHHVDNTVWKHIVRYATLNIVMETLIACIFKEIRNVLS